MTVVGQVTPTARAGEIACPSTGRWRRSSSWAEYAGRDDGKKTYVRGDIRRGLSQRLNSKKNGKIEQVPLTVQKLHTDGSKSLESGSTATTLASTAPRLSDLSSGVRISDHSSGVQFELSVSLQPTDEDVKAPEPHVLGEQKIEEIEKIKETEEVEKFEDKVEESPEATASDEELKRKEVVKLLFSSTFAHQFATQLIMPATQNIWLNQFNGDFAAQASTMSNLTSAALTAGIFVNPVIAGTSDVVGRKPVVMGGLAASVVGKMLCAVRPGAAALQVQTVLMTPLAMAHTLGVQIALGDLFNGDGKGFGAAQAQMMIATTMPGLLCPLIGANLTQRFGPGAPFAVAAIAEAGALLMDSKSLKETQPKEERKPLNMQSTLKSANPLAFLELFRHGPRLALLATMRMLNFACDKTNLLQVFGVHRDQTLGLTLQQNALYMMCNFFAAMQGFAFVGPLLQKLGTSACLRLGMSMRIVESLILSKATTLSSFQAVLPLAVTGASASTSVSAMLQDEATRVKLNQGEFQGSLSSLNTVTQVIVTLLWARIYAFGARRGKPGMYLQVIAGVCGLQLLLERLLQRMAKQNAPIA